MRIIPDDAVVNTFQEIQAAVDRSRRPDFGDKMEGEKLAAVQKARLQCPKA